MLDGRKKLFDEYVSAGYNLKSTYLQKFINSQHIAFYQKNFGKYLPADKNAHILEIGFGRGDFLRYLIKNNYTNFLGLEIGPEQYKIVKENISDRVILVEDTFVFLANNRDKFDAIVFVDVLEHIEKDRIIEFLHLVFEALKKGGFAFCRVPNFGNPFAAMARYKDFTHTISFVPKSLRAIFLVNDFQIIKVKGESFNFSLVGAIIQFFRSFIGLFIQLISLIYGGKIDPAKNLIAIVKK